MGYKVFLHQGDELSLKTRVVRGEAWVDEGGLHIKGPGEILVPRADLRSAEIFRLHGLGRVIRVEHANGRLFLSVVRLMIGQFAIINFFKTGALQADLVRLLSPNR